MIAQAFGPAALDKDAKDLPEDLPTADDDKLAEPPRLEEPKFRLRDNDQKLRLNLGP